MANSDYRLWTWMLDKQAHARFHVGIGLGEQGDPCRVRVDWLGGSAEFEPARTCRIIHEEDESGDMTEMHSCCGDTHTRDVFTGRPFARCPNCGAKVVD